MEFIHTIPIYLQVIDAIKRDIVNGILPMGEKLPSGRDLALTYKINPNTASRIYREMEAEGICYTKRGLGTFVTEDKDMVNKLKESMAKEFLDSFIHGMKSLGYTKEELSRLVVEKYDEGGARV